MSSHNQIFIIHFMNLTYSGNLYNDVKYNRKKMIFKSRGGNISMSDQRKIRLTETVHGAG